MFWAPITSTKPGQELLDLVTPLEIPTPLLAGIASGLPFFQTTERYIDNNSLAFFGQGTFEIVEGLSLTAGARWTRDEKDYDVRQNRVNGPTPFASGKQISREWTPMVNLAWKITPDILFYGTYSRGYRQGGFAARFPGGLPNPLPSYNPEFVNSYEIGFKSSWWNKRVTLNIAAFQTDYSDIQVNATTPTLPGFTLNLASARLRGIEAELNARLPAGFGISGNVGYVSDKLLAVAPGTTTFGGSNVETPITTANHLPGPDWQIRAGVNHRADLAGGELVSRIDWFHESSDYFNIANNAQTLRGAFDTVDVSLAYTLPGRAATVMIGARNVLDERYFTNLTLSSASGNVFGVVGRPREVFAQITYRFGH